MHTPPVPAVFRTLPRRLLWSGYAVFWLVIGLFQATAELQDYLRRGGSHPWEPFLWELSSTATSAVLVVGIFRLHIHLMARPSWPARIGGHALGLVVYVLLHSAGMYGMRAAVYAWTGVSYQPGNWWQVLAYESAKDVVSYMLFVPLSQAVLMFVREQGRLEAWQRLEAELAQARLARLQDQIQPHFLFNTLNLVSSVMYEDVERADRILSELADLLRRTLEASQAPAHTVQAELDLARPFLSIMQQRFADRLTVHVDASDDALRCEIPSLLLIPPLENAVKHGVAQSAAPTDVRVSAHVDRSMLELTVSDSAGQLERDMRPGSIGLPNTRERLAALFGASASVTLSREGGATVLRIRLPARRAA